MIYIYIYTYIYIYYILCGISYVLANPISGRVLVCIPCTGGFSDIFREPSMSNKTRANMDWKVIWSF